MENVNNDVVVVVLRNPGQSLAVRGGSDIRKNWVNFNILKYYNFPSCNIDHTRALNVGNLMACTAQLPCTSVNCLPFDDRGGHQSQQGGLYWRSFDKCIDDLSSHW